LYANLFNTAVTTHQKPVFTSECTETVWRPGLQLSLTPLAGFKWRAAGPRQNGKREKRGQKREEGREDFKRGRRQGRRLRKKGRKRQRVGKQGRRDVGIEGGKEEGREEGWTPQF